MRNILGYLCKIFSILAYIEAILINLNVHIKTKREIR